MQTCAGALGTLQNALPGSSVIYTAIPSVLLLDVFISKGEMESWGRNFMQAVYKSLETWEPE